MTGPSRLRAFFAFTLAAAALLLAQPAAAGYNAWTRLGLDNREVGCLVLGSEAELYAAAGYDGSVEGIWKSADGGETWTSASSGLPWPAVSALAVDQTRPDTLYAVDGVNSQFLLYKSTDGAATWSSLGRSGARSVLVADRSPSRVYVGLDHEVMSSADGGKTWKESIVYSSSDAIFDSLAIISLAAGRSDSSTIYAGSDMDYPHESIFESNNAGDSWVQRSDGLPQQQSVYSLAVDPTNPARVLAASSAGLWRSNNGGSSWTLALQTPTRVVVLDPTDPSIVYAGTLGQGVQISRDGGAHWSAFNEGGPNRFVLSLAIEATGRRLYAGTRSGVYAFEIAPVFYPCVPALDHLCSLSLMRGRFQISMSASDADRSVLAIGEAVPQGDEFGYFSLPQLTGDSALPEVVVKMADATSLSPDGGWFWVFYSALTSLPYEITVTDTATGQVRTYWSDGFCGGADTSAFPGGAAAGANKPSTVRTTLSASGDTLSLLGNRFQATLTATDPRGGTTAPGMAIPQGDRFGYFSLPAFTDDPNFPEVFVKMIDATSLPGGDFWLFHTGLTDLRYTLTVTDSVTGAVKIYQNDPSDPIRLCGGADTAFSVTSPP
ncbi:MAG TPA: hypothetical protein VKH43_02850 [Thermoanaerobaculia bacterium]|nr:hypothetical protein [Thermoanaerobaculia bacterium]